MPGFPFDNIKKQVHLSPVSETYINVQQVLRVHIPSYIKLIFKTSYSVLRNTKGESEMWNPNGKLHWTHSK